MRCPCLTCRRQGCRNMGEFSREWLCAWARGERLPECLEQRPVSYHDIAA